MQDLLLKLYFFKLLSSQVYILRWRGNYFQNDIVRIYIDVGIRSKNVLMGRVSSQALQDTIRPGKHFPNFLLFQVNKSFTVPWNHGPLQFVFVVVVVLLSFKGWCHVNTNKESDWVSVWLNWIIDAVLYFPVSTWRLQPELWCGLV